MICADAWYKHEDGKMCRDAGNGRSANIVQTFGYAETANDVSAAVRPLDSVMHPRAVVTLHVGVRHRGVRRESKGDWGSS